MKFPTQLTVLRIILSPVFYLLFVLDPPQYLWAAIVFAVASITDWYDGYFARKLKLVSRFGTFLDPLADKVLTSIVFIAFAVEGLIPMWAAIVIIIRDLVMTLLRMVADAHDMPVKTKFSAKVKTFVQMAYLLVILLALVAGEGTFGAGMQQVSADILSPSALWWCMIIIVLLTVGTFIQYLFDNAAIVRTAIAKYILRRNTQQL